VQGFVLNEMGGIKLLASAHFRSEKRDTENNFLVKFYELVDNTFWQRANKSVIESKDHVFSLLCNDVNSKQQKREMSTLDYYHNRPFRDDIIKYFSTPIILSQTAPNPKSCTVKHSHFKLKKTPVPEALR
jgi:hypothetical protein